LTAFVNSPATVELGQSERLAYGPLVLDSSAFCVTYDGSDIPVTYAEFLLLGELMRHPAQVITVDRLVGALKGARSRASMDTSPGAIRTRIARLRAKLELAGIPCIKTMRRVGYGFVPPPLHALSSRH
jgi:DNA-binding response OmpR family regulator